MFTVGQFSAWITCRTLKSDPCFLRSSLRDRLKKLTAERDSLESQLKNEKDERDLYKVGGRCY